ncbi:MULTISPECIES: hypothetical protein [unclassified Clostridium]|uniref:hypothetical protein n=1 Tax=unclassified Clostridium TaxID=2614128 RepID=UPI000297D180|nr:MULTISPECIES: hypothetical protein [unclassified Clostridium]EKQ55505.1 MAG: hypothetical protein A370_02721 [Clostridium sp. Maddingley MBC34-26]
MKALVKDWWKIAIIVTLCAAIDLTLHGVFGAIQGVDTSFGVYTCIKLISYMRSGGLING